MTLYEIKKLMKSIIEFFCIVFAVLFGGTIAILLAFKIFGVAVK